MKTEPIKFETLDQILTDQKCYELIQEKIDSIRLHRKKIIDNAKSGTRLKRGPFDVLDECAMLYHGELIAEFKAVKAKASRLALREREFITLIVSQAISGTIRHYKAQEEAQRLRAEKKKKRATKKQEEQAQ
ncbi:MAG: hypothetical protein WCI31_06220 [Prolixibacteraceae bacterium]